MRLPLLLSLLLLMVAPACDKPVTEAQIDAALSVPAIPPMPADWTVVADVVVPPSQLASFSEKLGAGITGARNTVYNVQGKRFQINLIVASTDADAAALVHSLLGMKAPEGVLRKGLLVYEFVGDNETLPLVATARQQIQ